MNPQIIIPCSPQLYRALLCPSTLTVSVLQPTALLLWFALTSHLHRKLCLKKRRKSKMTSVHSLPSTNKQADTISNQLMKTVQHLDAKSQISTTGAGGDQKRNVALYLLGINCKQVQYTVCQLHPGDPQNQLLLVVMLSAQYDLTFCCVCITAIGVTKQRCLKPTHPMSKN